MNEIFEYLIPFEPYYPVMIVLLIIALVVQCKNSIIDDER